MKRYEKIVLEAEKGINFEISEGTSRELVIRALNIDKDNDNSKTNDNSTVNGKFTVDDNSTNYENPPIPEGYKHVLGKWNNGFVIERSSDGSQFVWIPVGYLDANGTLDGVSFTEKFGRRKYCNEEFSESEFYETLTRDLTLQLESVKKYGGFYISRYNISKNKKTGKPQSVKGVMPWVKINVYDAKEVASTIEDSETVKSHLTFGAEYDSILEWFIKSDARTRRAIKEDSTGWGNYYTVYCPCKVVKTGYSELWRTNNIYDFAGNVQEWTQERNGSQYYSKRGGDTRYSILGEYNFPVAYRSYGHPFNEYNHTGFRAALYIK